MKSDIALAGDAIRFAADRLLQSMPADLASDMLEELARGAIRKPPSSSEHERSHTAARAETDSERETSEHAPVKPATHSISTQTHVRKSKRSFSKRLSRATEHLARLRTAEAAAATAGLRTETGVEGQEVAVPLEPAPPICPESNHAVSIPVETTPQPSNKRSNAQVGNTPPREAHSRIPAPPPKRHETTSHHIQLAVLPDSTHASPHSHQQPLGMLAARRLAKEYISTHERYNILTEHLHTWERGVHLLAQMLMQDVDMELWTQALILRGPTILEKHCNDDRFWGGWRDDT